MISYISLFILIFDITIPPVHHFGGSIYAFILIFIHILIYGAKEKNKSIIIISFKITIFIFIIITLYTLLRILSNGGTQYNYLLSNLKAFTIFIVTIFYMATFSIKNIEYKILNIFFINAIICLFIGTFNQFQFIINFFKIPEARNLIGYVTYRNSFLSGSGYFGIGAPFALAFAFLMSYFNLNKKLTTVIIIKLFFIGIVSILAARTSFIIIILTFIYLSIFNFKKKYLLYMVMLILLGYSIYVSGIFGASTYWIFEVFTKNITETSTGKDFFVNHLEINTNFNNFIFGDGLYLNDENGYYMNTDVGYLRHLYFGGIIYLLLSLLLLFSLLIPGKNKTFLFLIIPSILVLHLKGVVIINSPSLMPLLYFISLIYTRDHILKETQ